MFTKAYIIHNSCKPGKAVFPAMSESYFSFNPRGNMNDQVMSYVRRTMGFSQAYDVRLDQQAWG